MHADLRPAARIQDGSDGDGKKAEDSSKKSESAAASSSKAAEPAKSGTSKPSEPSKTSKRTESSVARRGAASTVAVRTGTGDLLYSLRDLSTGEKAVPMIRPS